MGGAAFEWSTLRRHRRNAPPGPGARGGAPLDMAPFCAKGLEAVHLLASSLRVDRSLMAAVRFAARNGSDEVRKALERLEWELQLRHHATLDEAFFRFAAEVGKSDPALKRALLTLQGAESETTREGLERRLDRALDIVLKADERRRELLSATLERPVTILLGAGVVLPLVLVTLVPLLQVSQPGASPLVIGTALLVVVPILTLLCASRIVERNMLGASVSATDSRRVLKAAAAPVLAAASAAALSHAYPAAVPLDPGTFSAALGALAACVAGGLLWHSSAAAAATREQAEAELPDLLHAIGSKMTSGRPTEQALLDAVEGSAGTALSERLRGVLFDVVVARRDLADAIARDEGLRSCGRAAPALHLMASTARRDGVEAGRVVQHLGEFERIRQDAAMSLRAKVRSVVETAGATTAAFAPLILGVTVGMYGLLSTLPSALATGSRSPSDPGAATAFASIVVVYLIMEATIVAWFGARLLGSDPTSAFGKSLARDVPLAMTLFLCAGAGAGALF